jgi:hypothetical protein
MGYEQQAPRARREIAAINRVTGRPTRELTKSKRSAMNRSMAAADFRTNEHRVDRRIGVETMAFIG